jgi:hypothetical protein
MLYDKGFPAIKTGESPDLIVDVQAFSPLQEMMHGYLWRLTCDGVIATGTPGARRLLAVFLARGETAITPASNFGANIPGCFCPNFAYHFKVANDWPTRVNPLTDLASLFTVSARAQEYDPITIDLHIKTIPRFSFILMIKLRLRRIALAPLAIQLRRWLLLPNFLCKPPNRIRH